MSSFSAFPLKLFSLKPRLWFFIVFSFISISFVYAESSKVDISTAIGQRIEYDNTSRTIVIEGSAEVYTSTATLKADKITINSRTNVGVAEGHAQVFSSTADLKADKITMNNQTQTAIAEGNVVVIQSSSTVVGDQANYDWRLSTGVFLNARGVSLPWRFVADQMIQESRGVFVLDESDFTSCDENPPHYVFHSNKARVVTGDRATMKRTTFKIDDTPVFWLPFYTRSLKPKKYSLRIEPGNSGRDGLIVKTVLGIPLTPNTYTNFKWDYFQRTGNGFGVEHRYFLPNVKGVLDTYYITDTNPDPQPESRRYRLDWSHFERFSKRLTMNSKINFQSDQTFGNQFVGGDNGKVENQVKGLLSETGFTYQFPKATLETQFNRRDKFDSTVSSESFISKITLPSISLTSVPLKWKYFPIYTSFSGSYINETFERVNSTQTLRYQRSARTGVQFKQDFRVRRWTVTPKFGLSETWQDRDLDPAKPDATTDLYQGRSNTGIDLRRRFGRIVDWTVSHNYGWRFKRNRTDQDVDATDHGVETNIVNSSLVSRVGRNSRVSLSSGYDLRQEPKDDPRKYDRRSARISPPSLDTQWEIARNINLFFREVYSVYDPVQNRSRGTPVNTAGEFQWGNPSAKTFFSQGFSYSKPAEGEQPSLNLNNRLKFYLTPKWYIDLYLSYRAQASSKMNYHKVHPVERTISVVRDLHCWVLRMEFSSRPDRTEASFYIDLKSNLATSKNVFNGARRNEFIPFGEQKADVSEIFPDPSSEHIKQ